MLFVKYSNTVLILETESVKEVSLIVMFTCSYPVSPKTKKNEYDVVMKLRYTTTACVFMTRQFASIKKKTWM